MMNERSVTFGRIGRAKYSEDGPINFHLLNRKSKTNLVFSMWQALLSITFEHLNLMAGTGGFKLTLACS